MKTKMPKTLKKYNLRFIKVQKGQKRPFEKKWQDPEGKNYEYDDKQFIEWLNKGNNYGVATGFSNLVVIDCDKKEAYDAVKENLPKTFTVKTPHGGKHVYFICNDLENPIRLTSGNAQGDIGDVQSTGKCVIGPNSYIKEDGKKKQYKVVIDCDIAKIKAENIKLALRKWIKKPTLKDVAKKYTSGKITELDISKVVDLNKLQKNGKEHQGSHPIHGSSTGANFCVNTEKNIWHCFRHDTGGNALTWLAVKEGIINCDEAVPGALKGEKFAEVLNIAKEKYGIKTDETRTIDFEPKNLTKHLKYFDKVDRLTKISGEEYIPLKKLLYYKTFSMPIEDCFLPFLGRHDLRINTNIIIMSGHGKSSNKVPMKFYEKFGKNGKTIDVSHPEQYKGTVMKSKRKITKKMKEDKDINQIIAEMNNNPNTYVEKDAFGHLIKYKKIPGWFSEEGYLVFPEGNEILKSDDATYKELRGDFSKILDPIGSENNKVCKRMTGHPPEAALNYNGACSIGIQTQPVLIPAETFRQGFMSRFYHVYIEPNGADIDRIRQALDFGANSDDEIEIEEKLEEMQHIAKFEFSEEVKDRLVELGYEIPRLLKTYSKGDRFLKLLEYRKFEQLARFACVLAGIDGREEVKIADIEKAYIDYVDILSSTVDWVNKFCKGGFSGQNFDENEENLLSIISARDKITIKETDKLIRKIFGVKERQAIKKRQDMKARNLLDYRQKGQHDSEVWVSDYGEKVKKLSLIDSNYYKIVKKIDRGARGALFTQVDLGETIEFFSSSSITNSKNKIDLRKNCTPCNPQEKNNNSQVVNDKKVNNSTPTKTDNGSVKKAKKLIQKYLKNFNEPVDIEKINGKWFKDWPRKTIDKAIENLKKNNVIFEPKKGKVKLL